LKGRIIYPMLVILLLTSLLLSNVSAAKQSTTYKTNISNPYALILINNGTIEVGETFNLTFEVNNPIDYKLVNVTFWLEIPLELEILSNETTAPTEFQVELTEVNTVNVSCKVNTIEKNSTFVMIFKLKGSKLGRYVIKLSSVKAVKVKGEYKKEITLTEGQELHLQVVKKEVSKYPKEGVKDPSLYILVFSVFLPMIILFFSRKIAWRT